MGRGPEICVATKFLHRSTGAHLILQTGSRLHEFGLHRKRKQLMGDFIMLAAAAFVGIISFAVMLKKFGSDCIP
jgi:hypothetical protein